MIRGFQSFKEWFMGYEQCYTIIGGTACDLLMSDYDICQQSNLSQTFIAVSASY